MVKVLGLDVIRQLFVLRVVMAAIGARTSAHLVAHPIF